MNEHPVPDENAKTRHAVRTRLNHIVGYSDILRQDAEDSGRLELGGDFSHIREAALSLRDPLARRFAAASPIDRGAAESPPDADELASIDTFVYGVLYELIVLVQKTKRKADELRDRSLATDVEKILEAANGVLELLSVKRGEGDESAKGPGEEGNPGPARTELLDEATRTVSERIGRILVVDDNVFNRELLARHLERQGHLVRAVDDGMAAMVALGEEAFDIMILDVMMPGMNGYQLLERVRVDPRFSDLYVIVISALGDTQSIARCIQLGAEDYLPREFEPVILRARIESCLEKKSLKAEQALYTAALLEAQERLRAELHGGASYVRSLLPPRLSLPGLRTDWMFIPSASLGGDVFGYNELPDGRLALYLLDVSGHGIESALFSCTVLGMLKTRAIADTDFGDPVSVLRRLNASFLSEETNNLYFTAWYGVWDLAARELRYSSAGSPPAVLVLPGGGAVELTTDGMIIGLDPDAQFRIGSCTVAPNSRLYLFSDGVYEFRDKQGKIFGLEPFIQTLSATAAMTAPDESALDDILGETRSRAAKPRFPDDVSLLEFVFG